ncbi:MAG: hypothetical protein JO148_06790 [Acidimicrobiia bacterium]|nr:hypothetical protein [Acidimicrobiia bacterium]
MASLIIVLVVVAATLLVVSFVRSRRHGLEAKRGLSIGADLGKLADTPTVTVRAVTAGDPGEVRVVFVQADGGELDLVVSLKEDDFGYELLRQWQRAGSKVAIVMPPDSRIVRLRSVDDLQPVTLRRVDAG